MGNKDTGRGTKTWGRESRKFGGEQLVFPEMLCIENIKLQTQVYQVIIKVGQEIAMPIKGCDFTLISITYLV